MGVVYRPSVLHILGNRWWYILTIVYNFLFKNNSRSDMKWQYKRSKILNRAKSENYEVKTRKENSIVLLWQLSRFIVLFYLFSWIYQSIFPHLSRANISWTNYNTPSLRNTWRDVLPTNWVGVDFPHCFIICHVGLPKSTTSVQWIPRHLYFPKNSYIKRDFLVRQEWTLIFNIVVLNFYNYIYIVHYGFTKNMPLPSPEFRPTLAGFGIHWPTLIDID